ncbi:cell division cycle-associated protein 4 [Eucyclogobius newberryi]|uniref:cell division cycle-associated protein 4 n=1 Tax=Eucyclogobius newberryi TaxID=166745 RepID=UPI003B5B547E
MLGRGVKRKWSCLEEELEVGEDKPRPDALPEGPSSKSQQRQVVLGLCLEKLQAGVELSLRRSVLLVNTLRQLQEEMQRDGEDGCAHRESRLLDTAPTCPDCTGEDDLDGLSSLPELSEQEENGLNEPKSLSLSFSDAVNAMGYLGDLALDDIFEDIDTSMYESSDLSSAWANGVSLWADEDIKARQQGALQSCISDLNELDHIMEILVKS